MASKYSSFCFYPITQSLRGLRAKSQFYVEVAFLKRKCLLFKILPLTLIF